MRIGDLGHAVAGLEKKVKTATGLKGSGIYEDFRKHVNMRYSYRSGEGLTEPDNRLAKVDLESLSKLDLDVKDVVNKLKSVRRRKKFTSEFWHKTEFKYQEQSFKKHMKALSDAANTVLPTMLAVAKYSEDCRSLMSNIQRARLIGVISNF